MGFQRRPLRPGPAEALIEVLEEDPQVVLAHSWTAMIDSSGASTKAGRVPGGHGLHAGAGAVSEMLFDAGSDYSYGVVGTRSSAGSPYNSYQFADRTLTAEIGLHGPFYRIPDWLYFRRDHPEAAVRAYPRCKAVCELDPRRADRLRNPAVRLYAEYIWGYVAAIRRAPLSPADRQECYRHLARWVANRALSVAGRLSPGRAAPSGERLPSPPVISVDALVAGRRLS